MGQTILTFALLSLFPFTFFSCKTTEEVKQEKKMEDLNLKLYKSEEQMGESHKILATQTRKMGEIESLIQKLTGEVEELRFQMGVKEQKNQEKLQDYEKRFIDLEARAKEQATGSEEIKKELGEQKKYRDEVLESISKLQESLDQPVKKKVQKKDPQSKLTLTPVQNEPLSEVTLKKALSLFEKGKYKDSEKILTEILNAPSLLNEKESVKALYYHGVASFHLKNFDTALISLSKVYKGKDYNLLMDNALFYIGKTLQKMGKVSEAKESFETLLAKFPKSELRSQSEKILQGL